MSDNTNTPNGDSKDLYSQNPDTGKVVINFPEDFIEEKDPAKESIEGVPGTNTVSNKPQQRDTGDIAKVGYVGIPIQPLTPEIRKAIEEKAAKSKEKHDKEVGFTDKNNDGIDDRFQ